MSLGRRSCSSESSVDAVWPLPLSMAPADVGVWSVIAAVMLERVVCGQFEHKETKMCAPWRQDFHHENQ